MLWHASLNSLVILLGLLEGCGWALMYIPLAYTNTYSCRETYRAFPGIISSILRLWILVNHFKFGCKGTECLKPLLCFLWEGPLCLHWVEDGVLNKVCYISSHDCMAYFFLRGFSAYAWKVILPTTGMSYLGIKRKHTTEAQLAAEH